MKVSVYIVFSSSSCINSIAFEREINLPFFPREGDKILLMENYEPAYFIVSESYFNFFTKKALISIDAVNDYLEDDDFECFSKIMQAEGWKFTGVL